MTKLRDLINESKFLKREFGDPLPTFEDVMEKHQVNKLKEGWWDNMSDAAQKAYIKKHGSAPGSAGGDDNGGDGDHEMAPDMDSRDYDVDDDGTGDDGGGTGGGDNSERLGQISQEKAAAEKEMAHAEEMGDKNAYADAEQKLHDLEQEEKGLGGSDEPDKKDDLGKPYPKGNAPPKTSMIDRFSSQKWLDIGLEEQKEYERHLNRWAEEAADNDDDETLEKIQKLMDECKAEQGRLEDSGASDAFDPDNPKIGSPYDSPDSVVPGHWKPRTKGKKKRHPGRTGNELNQETLTIDGKQYNRISEGVKKQPKPKYEFSEFYQRFKK